MKICIVASGDFFSDYGGGQKYVKNLVETLVKRKHDITVISIETTNKQSAFSIERSTANGFQVISLKKGITKYDKNPSELNEEFLHYIDGLLRDLQPEIVHANGYKYAFSKVCHDLKTPCIITAHHGGLVCPAGALLNHRDQICQIKANKNDCVACCLQWSKPLAKLHFLLKVFPQEFHVTLGNQLKTKKLIPYITPFLSTPLYIQHKLLEIETLQKYAKKIIAPSKGIQKALLTNGIDPKRIVVIPHGVETFEQNKQNYAENKTLHISYIGRINHIKGLHILFESLKSLKNYHLHIFGDAVTKAELKYKQKLETSFLDIACTWHGKISKEQLETALKETHLVILPSICLEIYGLVIAEAFAMRIPVIASKCGGPEDQVQAGINGYLVEPNNSQQLKEKIEMLLKNPGLLNTIKANIKEPLSFQEHVSKLENIYETTMQESITNGF